MEQSEDDESGNPKKLSMLATGMKRDLCDMQKMRSTRLRVPRRCLAFSFSSKETKVAGNEILLLLDRQFLHRMSIFFVRSFRWLERDKKNKAAANLLGLQRLIDWAFSRQSGTEHMTLNQKLQPQNSRQRLSKLIRPISGFGSRDSERLNFLSLLR